MHKLGPIHVGGSNPIRIMGILNLSPESFYKNSIKTTKNAISQAVCMMEQQGADLIDVGAMSTAPYLSTMITQREESKRLTGAIKTIQNVSNLPISVDTCRASVAKNALELGVDIINDVTGLKHDKDMAKIIQHFLPSVILCAYEPNSVSGDSNETKRILKKSIPIAKKAGLPLNKITLDPSIGFFRNSGRGRLFSRIKTDWIRRDLETLGNLKEIKQNLPIMVSISRKSFIGAILDKDPDGRLAGSLACEVLSSIKGADVIRTHNVGETRHAVRLTRTNKSL